MQEEKKEESQENSKHAYPFPIYEYVQELGSNLKAKDGTSTIGVMRVSTGTHIIVRLLVLYFRPPHRLSTQ